MNLYRFMSTAECKKLLKGETLENNTDHSLKRGAASTAKGFCFGIGDMEQAEKDFRRLIGIVDLGIFVAFTVKPESESRFTPCQGRYVDYDKIESEGKSLSDFPFGEEPQYMVNEYCATSYSLEDFVDYHIYGVLYNSAKHLSDPARLQLLEIEKIDSSKKRIPDSRRDIIKDAASEIVKIFIHRPDMLAGETFAALTLATSTIFGSIVMSGKATKKECFDNYVDMLRTVVFL